MALTRNPTTTSVFETTSTNHLTPIRNQSLVKYSIPSKFNKNSNCSKVNESMPHAPYRLLDTSRILEDKIVAKSMKMHFSTAKSMARFLT